MLQSYGGRPAGCYTTETTSQSVSNPPQRLASSNYEDSELSRKNTTTRGQIHVNLGNGVITRRLKGMPPRHSTDEALINLLPEPIAGEDRSLLKDRVSGQLLSRRTCVLGGIIFAVYASWRSTNPVRP